MRYYFHTFNGETEFCLDDLGQELAHRDAAWETATRYAADLLRDLDGHLARQADWRLEVQDETGRKHFLIRVEGRDVN